MDKIEIAAENIISDIKNTVDQIFSTEQIVYFLNYASWEGFQTAMKQEKPRLLLPFLWNCISLTVAQVISLLPATPLSELCLNHLFCLFGMSVCLLAWIKNTSFLTVLARKALDLWNHRRDSPFDVLCLESIFFEYFDQFKSQTLGSINEWICLFILLKKMQNYSSKVQSFGAFQICRNSERIISQDIYSFSSLAMSTRRPREFFLRSSRLDPWW